MEITFKIRNAVKSGDIVFISAHVRREHALEIFGEAEYVKVRFRPQELKDIIEGGDASCPSGVKPETEEESPED